MSRPREWPQLSQIGFGHAEWGCRCASHQKYMLTCDDFEEVWLRSGGRCEICRSVGRSWASGQPLYIDHDLMVGDWAVRGILCGTCNSAIPADMPPREPIRAVVRYQYSPVALEYLSHPWYRAMLSKRGVGLDMSEPAASLVAARHRRWRRIDGKWHEERQHRYSAPRSWWWLYRRFGPHNIVPVEA